MTIFGTGHYIDISDYYANPIALATERAMYWGGAAIGTNWLSTAQEIDNLRHTFDRLKENIRTIEDASSCWGQMNGTVERPGEAAALAGRVKTNIAKMSSVLPRGDCPKVTSLLGELEEGLSKYYDLQLQRLGREVLHSHMDTLQGKAEMVREIVSGWDVSRLEMKASILHFGYTKLEGLFHLLGPALALVPALTCINHGRLFYNAIYTSDDNRIIGEGFRLLGGAIECGAFFVMGSSFPASLALTAGFQALSWGCHVLGDHYLTPYPAWMKPIGVELWRRLWA